MERARYRLRQSWQQWFARPATPAVSASSEQLELFKRILTEAVAEVRSYRGRFVFVNIPAQETICFGRDIAMRHEVIDSARALGVDVIDLENDLRWAAADRGTAVVTADGGCGGHFSEIGYDVVHNRLNQYLQWRTQGIGLVDGWQHNEEDDQWILPGGRTPAGFHPLVARTVCRRLACATLRKEQWPISSEHAAVDLRLGRVVRCGMIDWTREYSGDSPAAPGTENLSPPPIARLSFSRRKCRCTDPWRPR